MKFGARINRGFTMPDQGAPNTKPRTVGELFSRMTLPAACIFIGLVVCIIASVAPWATSPINSAAGIDGDGKITIGIAALALVVLVVRDSAPTLATLSLILIGFGVFEAIHIHDKVSQVTLFGQQVDHVGWGVYALIAGGVLAFLGAWQAART
ncbi:MAG: hypothetical protein E6G05_11820 [Actinobacteria bacterium]|nr:MAG: hypothetical protein E6G05_11820 [Actinomycetota bacterium]